MSGKENPIVRLPERGLVGYRKSQSVNIRLLDGMKNHNWHKRNNCDLHCRPRMF